MSQYFGFTPSLDLQAQFKFIDENIHRGNDVVMYPYRDDLTLAFNAELIEAALISLVQNLPETDSKSTVLKVAHFCKSTVNVLLKQLLGKASNEQVLKSAPFLTSLRHVDTLGVQRVGVLLPDALANDIARILEAMLAGQHREVSAEAVVKLNALTDIVVDKFMGEFLHTLDLGMIKRKAAEMTQSGLKKALHVATSKILPSMGGAEAKIFATHYKQLFYQV